jgi:hypothetical protein
MTLRFRKRLASRGLAAAGTAVAAFAVIVVALAQSPGGWAISSGGATGGGGRSSLGNTAVVGVIGQPVVGHSSQGAFAVSSGLLDSGPVEFIRIVPAIANDGISPN